jgi:hypothetical protein
MDTSRAVLSQAEILALEAFADTILPGRKRAADDPAIAGVSHDPGAVEAGALDVLTNPMTGIDDGVPEMARMLNHEAGAYAQVHALTVGRDREFADLDYEHRRALVDRLTAVGAPMRDFWILLALFAYMAYDSAPHEATAAVMARADSGLAAMGFAAPGPEGIWAFSDFSYRRPLARLRAGTDEKGNLP